MLVGVALVVLSPSNAFACPVCGASTADNAWAYTVMSVMLTVLPLGMIGAGVFWVARRNAQIEADGRVPPPAPTSEPSTALGGADVPQHQNPVQLRSPRD